VSNSLLYAEIRFKNNGLDLIEVQDNGSGISPENYENVGELQSSVFVPTAPS
jgi:signal transduction histidine kinase